MKTTNVSQKQFQTWQNLNNPLLELGHKKEDIEVIYLNVKVMKLGQGHLPK